MESPDKKVLRSRGIRERFKSGTTVQRTGIAPPLRLEMGKSVCRTGDQFLRDEGKQPEQAMEFRDNAGCDEAL